jgi:hypothetical protein
MSTSQTHPTAISWPAKLLGIAIMVVVLLVSAEIAASAYYYLMVKPQFETTKAESGHYYRASNDPQLAYELKPGYQGVHQGRDLHINSLGFRGPELAPKGEKTRLAILGDSVTFSIWHADAEALPHLVGLQLQRDCPRGAEVLNLGVPGYGVHEVRELFQVKAPGLALDAAIYLMNLNDFAWRETEFEGADAGLYRMYHPPLLKLPFFVKKAMYRFEKGTLLGGMNPTINWYQWMIKGTTRRTLDEVAAMHSWARDHGIAFAVSILPAGIALGGGTNALAAEQKLIVDALRARGVVVADDTQQFIKTPSLFDETDHLTGPGNHVAAGQIAEFFRTSSPPIADAMQCRVGE